MIKLEYLIILLLATFFLIIFSKKKQEIGNFLRVLDIPKKGKIHNTVTPLIGSFPIFVLSIVLLIYLNLDNSKDIVLKIFLFSYLFLLMGYLDDRYGLNAYLKLTLSLIIVFIAFNFVELFVIEKIYIETFNKFILLGEIKIFFSVLCILLLINALNLMDGINGLASGFASGWLISLSLLSNDEKIFALFMVLSLFMLINTFLIIKGNYFLGDSGTLFLGCLIGLSTIYIYNTQLESGNFIAVEKIFIFFMIPGIDMFRLFLTRIIKKKDPFSRDLNHLHHLMLKYFNLYKTLLIYFFVFLISNLLSYFDIVQTWLIILIYLCIYIFFIFFQKEKFEKTS